MNPKQSTVGCMESCSGEFGALFGGEPSQKFPYLGILALEVTVIEVQHQCHAEGSEDPCSSLLNGCPDLISVQARSDCNVHRNLNKLC